MNSMMQIKCSEGTKTRAAAVFGVVQIKDRVGLWKWRTGDGEDSEQVEPSGMSNGKALPASMFGFGFGWAMLGWARQD